MGQEFESLQARQFFCIILLLAPHEIIWRDKPLILHMVGVAQMVRAPDCGSGGSRFDPDHPPQMLGCSQVGKAPDFDSGIS